MFTKPQVWRMRIVAGVIGLGLCGSIAGLGEFLPPSAISNDQAISGLSAMLQALLGLHAIVLAIFTFLYAYMDTDRNQLRNLFLGLIFCSFYNGPASILFAYHLMFGFGQPVNVTSDFLLFAVSVVLTLLYVLWMIQNLILSRVTSAATRRK